LITEEK